MKCTNICAAEPSYFFFPAPLIFSQFLEFFFGPFGGGGPNIGNHFTVCRAEKVALDQIEE